MGFCWNLLIKMKIRVNTQYDDDDLYVGPTCIGQHDISIFWGTLWVRQRKK